MIDSSYGSSGLYYQRPVVSGSPSHFLVLLTSLVDWAFVSMTWLMHQMCGGPKRSGPERVTKDVG